MRDFAYKCKYSYYTFFSILKVQNVKICSLMRAFSGHGKMKASFPLLIGLNENMLYATR